MSNEDRQKMEVSPFEMPCNTSPHRQYLILFLKLRVGVQWRMQLSIINIGTRWHCMTASVQTIDEV